MRLLIASLCAAMLAVLLPATPVSAQDASCGQAWTTYERPATYPGMATTRDVRIEMSDGVELLADVFLPADEAGTPAASVPVLLTITGYNKNSGAFAPNELLVPRGYGHVIVDDRGTGSSEGQWDSWGQRTQQDYDEILDWVADQPWSDGIGLTGPSYMGITSLMAAAHQHPDVDAVFAVVPMGDAYRDIVFAGGQVNFGFIPLWLGLVTAFGVVPPSSAQDDPSDFDILAEHLAGYTEFTGLTVADALAGGDTAYDGPFWRQRSPLEMMDRIDVPTFVVGGLDDLFQRGEPMIYEALDDRGVDTRLVIGPWAHLTPFLGTGGPDTSGVPDFDHLALRWFDDHMLQLPDARADCMPQVTQWLRGPEQWAVRPDWPHPDLAASVWHLGGDGALSPEPADTVDAEDRMVPPLPATGICSREADQWTAGLLTATRTPCASDGRLNESLEIVYTSEPFDEPMEINGPIEADLWLSSTRPDSAVTVRLASVAPDGTSKPLTAGSMLASLRAVDPGRSRLLDGQSIQPWHPFTEASKLPLEPGTPVEVAVEVFPTSAVVEAGHRLRVSIGPVDFPHNIPTTMDAESLLGAVTTIHHGARHPTRLVLPVVAAGTTASPDASGAAGDGAAGPATPVTGGGAALLGLLALVGAAGARRAGSWSRSTRRGRDA